MRGSSSRRTGRGSAASPLIALLAAALSCAGATGPAGTPLDCASPEAEEAITLSDVPLQYVLEYVIEGADCRAFNRSVLGD